MRTRKNPLLRLLGMIHKLHAPTGDFLNEIRFFCERGIYGWSSRDAWDISACLNKIIPEMILHLKEKKQGVPSVFLSPYNPTEEGLAEGERKFNKVLDEIVAGFEAQKRIQDRVWTRNMREENLRDQHTFENGIGLLAAYYDCLWW